MTVYTPPAIIRQTAFNFVRAFDTRDSFDISDGLGIKIYMRNDFQKIKGMYSNYLGERSIHVNANGTKEEQKMYCGHELGHDTFHRLITEGFIDMNFFDRDMTEYEANLFDAHLLLDEEEILDLAASEYSVDQIAAAMNTYRELLLIKLDDMNQRGLPVRAAYRPLMNFWSTRYR